MRAFVRRGALAASSCFVLATAASAQREPHHGLRTYAGFTDSDIREMETGAVVTKVLDTPVDNEVAIMGVVWVDASPEDFVAAQKDIESFESGDSVLAIQKIRRPPRLEDFAKLTFPAEDLDDLAKCTVGDCPVKVDEESLLRLQREVDWSAPDAHEQANRLIREIALEGVREYLKGGDASLAAYRDKRRPTFLAKEFDEMLENSPYLIAYDPEFSAYLDNFPNAELPGADEFLYWSKVRFGLKPTVRVSHVVIYPVRQGRAADYVIGSKMLYASHYFHTGLELKYLTRDTGRPSAKGFYLISVNRSRSDGLTGFFGGIVRRAAVSEAEQGLHSALGSAKAMLESSAQPSAQ